MSIGILSYEILITVIVMLGAILSLLLKRWIVFGIYIATAIAIMPDYYGYTLPSRAIVALIIITVFYLIDKHSEKKRHEKEAEIINYYESSYYSQTGNEYDSLARNDTGKYGEYLVFDELRPLENVDSKFLFNVYLPKKNGTTSEIDVIIIDKSGIYVIESKNYSGWIFGDAESRMWMQTLKNGNKNRFYNPILQNSAHCRYLKSFLNVSDSDIVSYIVFSNRCEFKRTPANTQSYRIIHRDELFEYVVRDLHDRGVRFTDIETNDIYNTLYPLTQTDDYIKQKHIDDINRIKQ